MSKEECEKMIKEIIDYVECHVCDIEDTIIDYTGMKDETFINELKKQEEHFKDIKRIIMREGTYADFIKYKKEEALNE